MCNRNRTFTPTPQQIEEDERMRNLLKIFTAVKPIEDEVRPQSSSQGSRTGQNFFSSSNMAQSQQSVKQGGEIISFKQIKESQLVKGPVPSLGYAGNRYHVENSELLYKCLRSDIKMVRSTLEANGFSHTESHEWNILWSSASCKSYIYEGLNEFQKINHFPQSYEITRKDRLCVNIVKMQEKFGKQQYDFVPDTYILPDEFGDFYAHFQKLKQHDQRKNVWIVKPANSSQGKGIYIIDDINEINVDELSVISRYITNPLLINSHKFDLRIYVCITSYEPLRVYIYKEGLARFASEAYSSKINKSNKFMHLTNYSVNKKNEQFVQNENLEQDDFGFKWSLSAFCKHLESVGIDMNLLWSRIYDLIMKTILSAEGIILQAIKKNNLHRNNCFELLGFDVIIDSDLKPWILEVNLASSLATESPLDWTIKSNLMADMLNLVGVKRFDRKKESMNKMKNRMKGYYNQKSTITRPKGGVQGVGISSPADLREQQLSPATSQQIERIIQEGGLEYSGLEPSIYKAATLKQKEIIHEIIAENSRRGSFVRIYPARGSEVYDYFYSGQRPLNKLIYKVLFTDEVLKQKVNPTTEMKLNYKIDMPPASYDQYKKQREAQMQPPLHQSHSMIKPQVDEEQKLPKVDRSEVQSAHPANRDKRTSGAQSRKHEETKGVHLPGDDGSKSLNTTQNMGHQKQENDADEKPEKVLITGDDILIEYVDRLISLIKTIEEPQLTEHQAVSIEKFITHYVWHCKDKKDQDTLCIRLESRLKEMLERRRRLVKYLFKKDGRLHEFEEKFLESIQKKTAIIKKFSAAQLEDLLKTSTKNVAQEVVSALIPTKGDGILTELDKINQKLMKKKPMKKEDESLSSGIRSSSTRSMGRGTTTTNTESKQEQLELSGFQNDQPRRSTSKILSQHQGNITSGGTQKKDQNNLSEMLNKREITNSYIKRILDSKNDA